MPLARALPATQVKYLACACKVFSLTKSFYAEQYHEAVYPAACGIDPGCSEWFRPAAAARDQSDALQCRGHESVLVQSRHPAEGLHRVCQCDDRTYLQVPCSGLR